MAGPGLTYHQPIIQVKTVSGNAPLMTGQIHEAPSQTFGYGVPLMLDAGGYVEVWNGSSYTNAILGVSNDIGHSLTGTEGPPPTGELLTLPPSQPFGSVGAPGAFPTFGSVPNQPKAYNIPPGAPMIDGRQVITLAVVDTIFEAQIDNSNTGTAVTALALEGKQAGLAFDSSSPAQAYVDLYSSATAAVIIVELNPLDPIGTAFGRVWFKFLSSVTVFA